MAWAAVGVGLASTTVGLINEGKANKKGDELSARRPRRQQSQYIKDDIALSESELVNPMSAAADRAYTTQADKEFSTSVGAINRGGGSVNNIGDVFARGEEGRTRLAILKDQARVSRVNNVLRSYQMANEEDQADFAFNEVAPWKDDVAANAQKKAVADSMVFSGISTAATAGMQYAEGKRQDSAYEKYFGKSDKGGNNSGNTTINGKKYKNEVTGVENDTLYYNNHTSNPAHYSDFQTEF